MKEWGEDGDRERRQTERDVSVWGKCIASCGGSSRITKSWLWIKRSSAFLSVPFPPEWVAQHLILSTYFSLIYGDPMLLFKFVQFAPLCAVTIGSLELATCCLWHSSVGFFLFVLVFFYISIGFITLTLTLTLFRCTVKHHFNALISVKLVAWFAWGFLLASLTDQESKLSVPATYVHAAKPQAILVTSFQAWFCYYLYTHVMKCLIWWDNMNP